MLGHHNIMKIFENLPNKFCDIRISLRKFGSFIFLFWMSSSSVYLKKGIEFSKEGEQLEKQNQSEQALKKHQLSLQYFQTALKCNLFIQSGTQI